MKAYIQPEIVDILLLQDALMTVATPSEHFAPPHFAPPGGEASGSLMFDAPGNKRRQL